MTSLVATSHILFGSDFPFADIGVTVSGASTLGLSAQARQEILRANTVALFPRIQRRDSA